MEENPYRLTKSSEYQSDFDSDFEPDKEAGAERYITNTLSKTRIEELKLILSSLLPLPIFATSSKLSAKERNEENILASRFGKIVSHSINLCQIILSKSECVDNCIVDGRVSRTFIPP